jgi:hypothetical protein
MAGAVVQLRGEWLGSIPQAFLSPRWASRSSEFARRSIFPVLLKNGHGSATTIESLYVTVWAGNVLNVPVAALFRQGEQWAVYWCKTDARKWSS